MTRKRMSKEDAACVWKCYTHSPTETWLTITPKSIHFAGHSRKASSRRKDIFSVRNIYVIVIDRVL